MNSDRREPAVASRGSRFTWLTIAVIALAAAGLAYQLRGQPQVLAEAGTADQARAEAGTPPYQRSGADETRSDQSQQIAYEDPQYCPTGEPGSGQGSGDTLCSLLRGEGNSPDGAGLLSRVRAVVVTGASKVVPVVQNFAQHCLAYLK